MKFVDETTVIVEAGKGGDGSRSFRREKYVPFGGPDGGDGGNGGSIYFEACKNINTLVDFRYMRRISAENGDIGRGKQQTGKSGKDVVVKVPVGTIIKDNDTDEVLGDLSKEHNRILVAQGGSRGLGNMHFKTSTNRAPTHATNGKMGECRQLHLELKLLADVGLLGLPNAGKSTLISAVSKACPKVADYPFTTLVPQLGTVRLGDGASFVIADIPGIIEGAADGAGLGHQFLRHLSRNKLLLHLVDVTSIENDPIESINTVTKELANFDRDLINKPRWLVLNKTEHMDSDELESWEQEIRRETNFEGPIYTISALAKKGLDKLCKDCMEFIVEVNCEESIVDTQDTSKC